MAADTMTIEKLGVQAFRHTATQTFPHNTLFNAVAAAIEAPDSMTMIDCDGRNYPMAEIITIADTAAYSEPKAWLSTRGYLRD